MGTLVKTQIKCYISSGSVLFSMVKTGKEVQQSLVISTCDPLKCTVNNPKLIVSNQVEESISIQRVKVKLYIYVVCMLWVV